MKICTMLIVASLSFGALAQKDEEKKEMSLEQLKGQLTEGVDKKIASLQSFKSCISAAQNKEAIKECRKKMHEQNKSRREEFMKNREHHKGKWKKNKDKK